MSVRDFQSGLIQYRRPLAAFVALAILLCALLLCFVQTDTAEVYIQYLGEDAELGLAADGTPLDPNEIRSALVVKRALEQLGLDEANYTAVRQNITVTPILSNAEEEKYASWIENFNDYSENEEKKAFPTYYSVKFRTDEGAVFARDLLHALVQQYRAYYAEKYAYRSDVTALPEAATMRYDYYETATMIEHKVEANIANLRGIAESDIDYRSPATGFSLLDLAGQYQSLQDTRLSGVIQYILENGVSKNTEVLTAKLQERIWTAQHDSLRNEEMAQTQKELMTLFAQKNDSFLWDVYSDEEGSQVREDPERNNAYYEGKMTYDQLMDTYADYAVQSEMLRLDAEGYENDLGAFSGDSGADPWLEEQLTGICEEFNRLHELTEETISGYNYFRNSRYIARVSGIHVTQTVGETIWYAASIVLSLGLGLIVIVYLQMRKKKQL